MKLKIEYRTEGKEDWMIFFVEYRTGGKEENDIEYWISNRS